MKKTLSFLLIIGLTLFVAACNTNDGGPGGGGGGGGGGEGGGDSATFNYDLELKSGSGTVGGVIDLKEGLLDISQYASVTVDGELRGEDGKPITPAVIAQLTSDVETGKSLNLAQFFLLKEGSNYGSTDADILGGSNGKKYNMVADGKTTLNIPPGLTGKLTKLQVETIHPDEIKSIYIRTIEFTPRTADPSVILDKIYGDKYTVSGKFLNTPKAAASPPVALLNIIVFPSMVI